MTLTNTAQSTTAIPLELLSKLWIYTNYDCNLSCTYCVAELHPRAPRRAITLDMVKKIVDEAEALGFETIIFTGGEPLLRKDIYAMLAYSSAKLPTTVLTNAVLLNFHRLRALEAIKNENLCLQVSLDGSRPEHHDPNRGAGTWRKTMDRIGKLRELGFRVRISATETCANTNHLAEIREFFSTIVNSEEDFIIRPLANRGFSDQGVEVGKHNLLPEVTINIDGVYWHPLTQDPDMQVRAEIFPLQESLSLITKEFKTLAISSNAEMEEFQ